VCVVVVDVVCGCGVCVCVCVCVCVSARVCVSRVVGVPLTPLSARLLKLGVVVRLELDSNECWDAAVAKARVGQAEKVVPLNS
jgi:hypothetical protein